jgi:hypothetical protein
MLPDALPSRYNLYAPRGVWIEDGLVVAADTGNHRVLIWRPQPVNDHPSAAVVLGQPDFNSEGPNAGGGPATGLYLPTGILVHEGKLLVADAWNHRVVVWNRVPEESGIPPDYALGQANLQCSEPNRGQSRPGPLTLNTPYGISFANGWFYVCDTSNRRVLGWQGLPEPGQPPDLLLGQRVFEDHEENRGRKVSADSLRWPHGIAATPTHLYLADAGNHRVLGWALPLTGDRPADLLFGQPDFETAREWPYGPQTNDRFRFPYAVACLGSGLAIADTANNRVLFWESAPTESGAPAEEVMGQSDFASNGENQWKKLTRDTLCWPYGVHASGDGIAIADSGNNRVMIWRGPA